MPGGSSFRYTVGINEWQEPRNKRKSWVDEIERFFGCSEADGNVDPCKNGWFLATLSILTLMTILNLSLNLWLIRTLHLRNGGLGFGNFLIRDDGLDVLGKVRFEGGLEADEVKTLSKENELSFNNQGTISLHSNNGKDNKFNSFTLGEDQIEMQAENLQVKEGDEVVFKVLDGEITTGTIQNFAKSHDGGIKFTEYLQTDSIQGHYAHSLRLESRTNGIEVVGRKSLSLDSLAGHFKGQSFDDIFLSSNQKIILDSLKIELKNLKLRERQSTQSYQVCGCLDGKIFLVPGSRLCEAGPGVCPTSY